MKGFPLLIIISLFIISLGFEIKDNRENSIRILQDDDDETDLNNTSFEPPEGSPIQKPILLGFNSEKHENSEILKEINIFFKNVPGKSVFQKYIYFTVNYKSDRRRRRLDEGGSMKKAALKGVLDESTLKEDIVKYNVQNENKEIKAFTLEKNIQFLNKSYSDLNYVKNKLEELDESISDVEFTQDFSFESAEQDYNENSFTFFYAEEIKQFPNKQIQIIGKFSQEYEQDNNTQLKLFCPKCFPTDFEFDGYLEKYNNADTYSLTCYLSDVFKINLENAYGDFISNDQKLRYLQKNNKGKRIFLSGGDDDLLNIDYNYISTISNLKYQKKNDGLSAGAITGIVVGCVAVLIFVTVLAIYFGRKKKAIGHSSAIEFYNSTFALNNDK